MYREGYLRNNRKQILKYNVANAKKWPILCLKAIKTFNLLTKNYKNIDLYHLTVVSLTYLKRLFLKKKIFAYILFKINKTMYIVWSQTETNK